MSNQNASRRLIYAALVVVAVVVVWGFSLIGSPSFNRKVTADRNRIEDLGRLRDDVEQYFQDQRKLPEKLTDLEKVKRWNGYQRNLEDPATKKQYDYKASDTYSYELCSDFELTSKEAELEQSRYNRDDKSWEHGVGHHCFKFDIPEGKRKGKAD